MKKEKRGAAPGSNRGGGRKKSERPLKDVHIKLFADQLPIKNAEIRQAVDEFKARTLSETFIPIPSKTESEDL